VGPIAFVVRPGSRPTAKFVVCRDLVRTTKALELTSLAHVAVHWATRSLLCVVELGTRQSDIFVVRCCLQCTTKDYTIISRTLATLRFKFS
jgi:hypothetical protein